jgi:hypothetical protein
MRDVNGELIGLLSWTLGRELKDMGVDVEFIADRMGWHHSTTCFGQPMSCFWHVRSAPARNPDSQFHAAYAYSGLTIRHPIRP